MFTLDEVDDALPTHLKGSIGPEILNNLNKVVTDPIFAEELKGRLVTYTSVLKEGKFKTADYFSAVTYVSFKLMGLSDLECYKRTFPDRYQNLVAAGRKSNEIAAYVCVYNKGKLVNLILEQALVPYHILNQDMFQKALNIQLELAMTASSEKVRSDAANSILTHLKPPEQKNIKLSVDMQKTEEMDQMFKMMNTFAENQQKLIEMGVPTQQIAQEKIITDADYADLTQ